MTRKKITLGKEKETESGIPKDPAAAIAAPGQETFKTPDVSTPAKDPTHVSDDSVGRFAEQNIDWNKALDDTGNEPEEEIKEVVVSEVVAVPENESIPLVEEEEKATSEEIVAKEDEIVEDDEEFQPAPEIDPPVILTQEELDKDYTEKRELAVSQVMERYEMTEEQRDQFLTNPEDFLPKMAAQVYVDVYESVLGAVSQMLPERVTSINAQYAENQEKTKKFFTKWPALNNPKGVKEVTRIGLVYRELNKDASSEDFINNVGVQASLSLGVEIPGVVSEAKAPETDDTPAFIPSGSNAISDSIPIPADPRKSSNQFERLNASWDD